MSCEQFKFRKWYQLNLLTTGLGILAWMIMLLNMTIIRFNCSNVESNIGVILVCEVLTHILEHLWPYCSLVLCSVAEISMLKYTGPKHMDCIEIEITHFFTLLDRILDLHVFIFDIVIDKKSMSQIFKRIFGIFIKNNFTWHVLKFYDPDMQSIYFIFC